jgi:hypothetical protein
VTAPKRTRTRKGDAFLARFATSSPSEMLADSVVQDIVAKYRTKFPEATYTDEEIVDRYARYLAGVPTKRSAGRS